MKEKITLSAILTIAFILGGCNMDKYTYQQIRREEGNYCGIRFYCEGFRNDSNPGEFETCGVINENAGDVEVRGILDNNGDQLYDPSVDRCIYCEGKGKPVKIIGNKKGKTVSINFPLDSSIILEIWVYKVPITLADSIEGEKQLCQRLAGSLRKTRTTYCNLDFSDCYQETCDGDECILDSVDPQTIFPDAATAAGGEV